MEGMATVKVQKGQTIVKQKDKVHKWFLICLLYTSDAADD